MTDKANRPEKGAENHTGVAPSIEPVGIHQELHMQLAQAAQRVAEQMHTRGYAGKATREALHEVGIEIPRSNSAEIKDIPNTKKIDGNSTLQPGDIVISGVTGNAPYGRSFVVTPDMKAAGSDISALPNVKSLPDLQIYRPQNLETR